jgi:hypothetical protein
MSPPWEGWVTAAGPGFLLFTGYWRTTTNGRRACPQSGCAAGRTVASRPSDRGTAIGRPQPGGAANAAERVRAYTKGVLLSSTHRYSPKERHA